MPLHPSKSLHFDSWEKLLKWLPKANESQLITVFVWTGDLKAPAGDARQLAQVRKDSFELLVTCTRERLSRFLLQRCQCRDVHLADDVVQQVLVKLYLRAEQYDPQRSFWGWLYRVARNEYIDSLRRIRPGDIGIGGAGPSEDDLDNWLASQAARTDAPEAALLEAERQQKFNQAVASLPRLQRSIVQLKLEGVKGKEIAARLGISQAYVSQLYHEAGELLREASER